MTNDISDAEARLALNSVEDGRRQVIAEIDLPRWYWIGLAVCWVGLGVVADLGNPWVSTVATVLFGAAHAAVAPRALSGRHRTTRVSVRADLVGRHVPAVMFACLVALGAVTVGVGFWANADGARHSSTMAGILVAVAILCGGPSVMAAVRRRAVRNAIG